MKEEPSYKYPSGFWSINIGHIGTIIITVFALGVAYQKIQSSIEMEVQTRRYADASIEQRLAAIEAVAPQLSGLTREMAELKIEMRYLRESISTRKITQNP